jgi:hypothetical protein
MAFSGMLRGVALVRIDVSEELSASFLRVTRLCELGTMLDVTSKRRTLSPPPPFSLGISLQHASVDSYSYRRS